VTAKRLVNVRVAGRLGYLAFDRPEKLNAMNNQLLEEFSEAIASLGGDVNVSAIIISGVGRSFSAGFDVDPANGASDAAAGLDTYRDWESLRRDIHRWLAVWDAPKPVLSAIEGHCLGAATMLAVCPTLRL
jgi:enoyl-CoA hydratase